MKTSKKLQLARWLIEDPANWTTGVFRTPDGKMCAVGALCQVGCVSDYAEGLARLHAASYAVTGGNTNSMYYLNDQVGHAAVMEAYDIAISMAMSDEAVS